VGYGLGDQRKLIVISEGCDGWGWLKFVEELSMAIEFFVASMSYGSEFPDLAEKKGGKKVGPWLGTGLSFVEVLRVEPRFYTVEKLLAEELRDPLGIFVDAGNNPLGKNYIDVHSVQGNGNCLFDDEVKGGR
jgi:hypothetical protein